MLRIRVQGDYDVGTARRQITEFSLPVSFSDLELAQLAIIITEMATNLVRHTIHGGVIQCEMMPDHQGLVLEAIDDGPGIASDISALSDGVSTQGGSMGGGLGAIQRLSDSFNLTTNDIGTKVRITKLAQEKENPRLTVGVCSRPYPGFDVNGDGFYVCSGGVRSVIAVYDALGHGKEAYDTATLMYKCLQELHGLELSDIVNIAHKRLLYSRGVALWLGAVYHNDNRLSYISLGNVEARLITNNHSQTLLNQNGTVGGHMPKHKINEISWMPGSVLSLATDGISSRWQVEDYPEIVGNNSNRVCQRLLKEWGRNTDDATIMIVRDIR
ncbi:ATP-binding protein [Pelosinus sp. sgz500959]|uniref:ATP-binding protein n=1 Tax=Pelosinus sp. sgz500959 TaxID=3242472 RepID=UPI00366F2774